MPLSDEDLETAKRQLIAAIDTYITTVYPGSLIGDSVVVFERQSIREGECESLISVIDPTFQPIHRTLGLLNIATRSYMDDLERITYDENGEEEE